MADTVQTAQTPPSLECDLVMKGGITSGVIYPRLVSALSNVYRLRSIGGTSAGAIAAAAAAAAQLGGPCRDEHKGVRETLRAPGRPREIPSPVPAQSSFTCSSRIPPWRSLRGLDRVPQTDFHRTVKIQTLRARSHSTHRWDADQRVSAGARSSERYLALFDEPKLGIRTIHRVADTADWGLGGSRRSRGTLARSRTTR